MGHIATDTTTIEVENISLFPTYGVIRIDQETMTYDGTESSAGVQALSITGVVQPGRLLNVRRGVRGAIVPHQAGAAVTLVRTCRGDCDISDDVSVADLSMMVQAALGMHPFAACIPGDSDGSHDITIEDIIAAANDASAECRVALVPTSQTARP